MIRQSLTTVIHNRKVRRPRMVSIRSGQMNINRVAWWRQRIGAVAACKTKTEAVVKNRG